MEAGHRRRHQTAKETSWNRLKKSHHRLLLRGRSCAKQGLSTLIMSQCCRQTAGGEADSPLNRGGGRNTDMVTAEDSTAEAAISTGHTVLLEADHLEISHLAEAIQFCPGPHAFLLFFYPINI